MTADRCCRHLQSNFGSEFGQIDIVEYINIYTCSKFFLLATSLIWKSNRIRTKVIKSESESEIAKDSQNLKLSNQKKK